ncbi:MAG: hypothetical protein WBQ94_07340 [Terracidiphilus sp.]
MFEGGSADHHGSDKGKSKEQFSLDGQANHFNTSHVQTTVLKFIGGETLAMNCKCRMAPAGGAEEG